MSQPRLDSNDTDYALDHLWTITQDISDKLYLEEFAARWNGLNWDALAGALKNGSGTDKLFAILALGHTKSEEAHALLLPILESTDPWERWASVTCLAQMGDRRSTPVLCSLLGEDFPTQLEHYLEGANGEAEHRREHAPPLLGILRDPTAAPALRQSLQRCILLIGEQNFVHSNELLNDPSDINIDRLLTPRDATDEKADQHEEQMVTSVQRSTMQQNDTWRSAGFDLRAAMLRNLLDFQDDVVYALGRLGGFGALTNLHLHKSYLQVWMVHLVMGYLHGSPSWFAGYGIDLDPTLRYDIETLLEQKFGLERNERSECISLYLGTKVNKLMHKYEEERRIHEQGGLL